MNPQGTKLDIGWLGESWKILQSRMGEYIGMILIAGAINYVISLIVQLPFNLILPSILDRGGLGVFFGVFAVQLLVSQIAQGVTYILFAGIIIFTLKVIRGEPAKFEDLFIAFKNPAPYFVAGLLVGLASAVGVIACCVGQIVVAGLLMFVFPLIYDRKLSAVAAFQESINILKDQWLMASAYIFVTWLFAIVGVVGCIIGIIVTLPIAFISQALAYEKIVGGPGGVNLSASQYPRNPGDEANMPAAPSAWPTEAPASTVDPVPPGEQPSDPQPPVEGWGDTMADNAPQPPAPDSSATIGEADVVIEDPKPEDHRPS